MLDEPFATSENNDQKDTDEMKSRLSGTSGITIESAAIKPFSVM